jgi:hypothetical protein
MLLLTRPPLWEEEQMGSSKSLTFGRYINVRRKTREATLAEGSG